MEKDKSKYLEVSNHSSVVPPDTDNTGLMDGKFIDRQNS